MTAEEERREPEAGDDPEDAAGAPEVDRPEAQGDRPESQAAEQPEAQGDQPESQAAEPPEAQAAEQPAADAEARDAAVPTSDEPMSAEAPAVDDPDSGTREPSDHPPEPGTPDHVSDPDAPAQAPGGQATGETSEALPSARPPGRGPRRPADEAIEQPEVVPGADLEPDLVLDEPTHPGSDDEYGDAAYAARYAEPEAEEAAPALQEAQAQAAPSPRSPRELAADARYMATGKRKTSVARVILKPGTGTYTINGRALGDFFPRQGLQNTARQPLVAAGYEARMDVVARLHGGGVSSQAGALRHGVARALADADPSLRTELKRRGYLTRDPRAKERKKAGLKKARKRPQFSKR